MGWWPFSGGSQADPIDKLDPKLRAFLEKESPVKYSTAAQPQSQPQPAPPSAKSATGVKETPKTTRKDEVDSVAVAATADPHAVPAESLYQDGRYAHLWKGYKPQSQIEAENATDHEKLMNVLEGYQDRKRAMTAVAMENCAEWQEKWINCMKNGDYKDQMQMCRHQVRRFEQCYTMQSRFLRALGYGSAPGRDPQVDEDIQMHADALYQRVIQHEDAVEKAQAEGRPIPKFDPVLPTLGQRHQQPGGTAVVQASEEVQEQWREKLEQLPEEERAAEEAALRADLQHKSAVAKDLREILGPKVKDGKGPGSESEQGAGMGSSILSMLRGGK